MDIKELIGNKKLMKILDYLIDNSDKEVIQRQLIEGAKVSKATTIKWIKFLVKRDLVKKKKIGTSYLLSVDSEDVLIKELKKTKMLLELGDIKELEIANVEVYLYGSCARGDYQKWSDVDLLIIGDIKRGELIKDIEKISEKIKREINFKMFTKLEWSKMYKGDKAFYDRVEKDKVRLL